MWLCIQRLDFQSDRIPRKWKFHWPAQFGVVVRWHSFVSLDSWLICCCRLLNENQITSIPSGAFTDLNSLTTLFVLTESNPWRRDRHTSSRRDLSRNWITSIKSGDFSGPASLQSLFVTLRLDLIRCYSSCCW